MNEHESTQQSEPQEEAHETAEAAEPSAPAAKTFTQSEMDAIIQKRVKRAEAKARRDALLEKEAVKEPTGQTDDLSEVKQQLAQLTQLMAANKDATEFQSAAAKTGIPEAHMGLAEAAWKGSGKPDAVEFLSEFAKAVGIGAKPEGESGEALPTAAVDAGAPSPIRHRGEITNPAKLTMDDIDQMGGIRKARDKILSTYQKQSGTLPQVFGRRGSD